MRFVLRQRERAGRLLLDGDGDSQSVADREVRARCRRAEEAIDFERLGLAE